MTTLTSAGREPEGRVAGAEPLPLSDERRPVPAGIPPSFMEAGSLPRGSRFVSVFLERSRSAAQRWVARSGRSRLRPFWKSVYALLARLYAAYVVGGEPGASAYLGGSLASSDPLYGISDIDLTFVLPDDAGRARARARQRAERLERLPVVATLFDYPSFFERADLEDAAAESVLTYGLRRPGAGAYAGPVRDIDKIRMQERPRLSGPTSGWRRLRGPERPLPKPQQDADRLRIAAWLEVQYWWRAAIEGALYPERAYIGPLCSKLLSEPARIWLLLARGVVTNGRADTLARAAEELPAEAAAFERAARLERELRRPASGALAESTAGLLRLSRLIADELAAQVADAGTTSVRLVPGELVLPAGGWPRGRLDGPALAPLADWRAVVFPMRPDNASAVLAGDPGDPATLASITREFLTGVRPALRAGDLLVRPARGGAARMRTIQSPLTDPVSFALAAGASSASFPEVAGWSARDWARRAVAEHRAWLTGGFDHDGRALGILMGAARAALFLESVEADEPRLALTASAALDLLGRRVEGAQPVAERAWEAYVADVDYAPRAPAGVVRDLEHVVRDLPAYEGAGS